MQNWKNITKLFLALNFWQNYIFLEIEIFLIKNRKTLKVNHRKRNQQAKNNAQHQEQRLCPIPWTYETCIFYGCEFCSATISQSVNIHQDAIVRN